MHPTAAAAAAAAAAAEKQLVELRVRNQIIHKQRVHQLPQILRKWRDSGGLSGE